LSRHENEDDRMDLKEDAPCLASVTILICCRYTLAALAALDCSGASSIENRHLLVYRRAKEFILGAATPWNVRSVA
jgi:hypothetical protein